MEKLNLGTKELLVIPVTDSLGNLTVIPSATYDVRTADDEETVIVDGAAAIVHDGMTLLVMIDSSDTGPEYTEGVYEVFVMFPATPELPKLGPHRFRLDN